LGREKDFKLNTEDYKIGVDSIDDHHGEVFQLTNMLDAAIVNGDRDSIDPILIFLETNLLRHFEEEEALMKSAGFSGYRDHFEQHQIFEAKVLELRSMYDSSPHATHLAYGVRRFIDALIYHILTIDVKMQGLKS
jgi:hemerythrin